MASPYVGRAARGSDLRDLAAVRCCHQVFHLHQFENGDIPGAPDSLPRPRWRRWCLAGAPPPAPITADRRRAALRPGRWSRPGSAPGREEQRPCDFLCGADQRSDMGIDEVGGDAVGGEIRDRQHRLDERDVGGDTYDAEFAQGARSFLHHIGPASAANGRSPGQQRAQKGALVLYPAYPKVSTRARAGRPMNTASVAPQVGFVAPFSSITSMLMRSCMAKPRGAERPVRQAERGQGSAGGDRELRLTQSTPAPPRSRYARPGADWPR